MGATTSPIFHTHGEMAGLLVDAQLAMDVTKSSSVFTAPDVDAQLFLQVKLRVERVHLDMDPLRMAPTASSVVKDSLVMWAFAADALQDEAQAQTSQRVCPVE